MPIGIEWFENQEPKLEELISERNLLIKQYEKKLAMLVNKYWTELEYTEVNVEENGTWFGGVTATFENDRIKICATDDFEWSIEHKGNFPALHHFPKLLPKIFGVTHTVGLNEYERRLEKEIEKVLKERTGELSADDSWENYYKECDLIGEIKCVRELKEIMKKMQDLKNEIDSIKEKGDK